MHTRFKKGQTGNPNGRPKLPDLKAAIAACLADEQAGKTALEAALAAMRAKAVRGDVRALELLLDRGYGKALQTTDITSNGQPLQLPPPIAWTDDPAPPTAPASTPTPPAPRGKRAR